MTTPKNALDFALAYSRQGLSVLPVWSVNQDRHCRCPRGKTCQTPGKHPHSHLTTRGYLDATTDEQTIRDWWTGDPDAGVAIALSVSGLLALDIDPRNGGWETLGDIEVEHGPIASSWTAKTQGGGEHRVFSVNEGDAFPGTIGPGLDLKHRGYICVEPTQGPEGSYKWKAGGSPLAGNRPPPLPAVIKEKNKKGTTSHHSLIRPASVIVPNEVYEELEAALGVIPPELAYDDWFKVLVGMSRLHLTERARGMTRDWSIRSIKPGHTSEAFDAKWASVMKESGRTNFQSIFYFADRYHPGWRDQEITTLQDPWPEIDLSDLQLEPIDYLIDDFLGHSLMVLAGKAGLGKSTAMVSLCAAVAGVQIPGSPLCAPVRGRKVIYVAEDTDQFKRNLIALERNLGLDLDELKKAIILVPARRVLADELKGLKEKVSRHSTYTTTGVLLRPWLVFDTTSSSIQLADENSNAEVSNALAHLKACFYEEMRCPVCLIAHVPKSTSANEFISDARGAGAWIGDATLTSGLFEHNGSRYLMLGKRRYSPRYTALRMELHSTCVTTLDRYGREQAQILNSVVLQWADPSSLDNASDSAHLRRQALAKKVLRFINENAAKGRLFSQNRLFEARQDIEDGLGKDRLTEALNFLLAAGHLKKGQGKIGLNSGWEFSITDEGLITLRNS